jgi:hypothetical protein
MKLPHWFVTKVSLSTVLAASAGLGWATPGARAGLILPDPVQETQDHGAGFTTTALTPSPFVGAAAETINGLTSGSAEATLTYFFAVVGPSSVQVPIEIHSFVVFKVTNALLTGPPTSRTFFNLDASVSFQDLRIGHQPQTLQAIGTTYDGGDTKNLQLSASETKTSKFNLESGLLFSVSLSASVDIQNLFIDQDTLLNAAADPVISFAPGFDSTGFSLEFSPGVGNSFSSDTPEPSTLVLSSIVFGMWGIVWACRQRRRTRAAA